MIPPKLQKGDEIRIIAPSGSLSLLSEEVKNLAVKKLNETGFKITFSLNCSERDVLTSSIKSRTDDICDVFKDKNVKAALAAIGGSNSNQLLKYLDYELIRKHPKILCGYSDITALTNAITAKTGLVTYSGPNFSTWGMKKGFEYNVEYFKKCLIGNEPYAVEPSQTWSDDPWYKDQEKRNFIKNEGYKIVNEGEAEGTILGGNLCTFNLLQGTEFMPDLRNSILFLEDDDLAGKFFSGEFDRNLQSLIHQPNFDKVRGIVIGRFQKKVDIDFAALKYIVKTKKELEKIPVISNADFGHTNPLITFPIGGKATLTAYKNDITLKIIEH